MGRSRGGLTSKIHALVDADGRPVALRLTGGQVHDSQEAEALLDAMPDGATLLADKGYDSNAIREAAANKNVWANIPSRPNRKQRFAFSDWLYRQRNLVERFFNRISTSGASPPATTSALRTISPRSGSSALASGAPRNESTA
jgi:transposase